MVTSVYNRPITETPIAIIDFETTGLSAGNDRVIEVSVVRVDPNEEPRLVFDTLVNPQRRVSATEIHGITDEEFQYIIAERQRLQLPKEQIRALHARAFASVILQFCADEFLDDREAKKLRRLRTCLTQLGWAPGD